MAHVGTLRNFRFQGDIDDIRGSNIYNRNDEKLGDIDDIIFNHETGIIQYLVVDTGGWLSSHKFLVPADRVTSDDDGDRYYIDLSKQQIEAFPEYNESMHEQEGRWDEYEDRYRDSWTTTGGILHKEGSQNILTPDASEMPPVSGSVDADVTPTRIAPKFTNTAPTSDKTRLRPEGIAARAEDSKIPGNARADWQESESVTRDSDIEANADPDATADLTDAYPEDRRGRKWFAFEENLRRNRVDITAGCRSCSPARDKDKAA
jgi:sporulation protein YlmC with PRC-barrel domain